MQSTVLYSHTVNCIGLIYYCSFAKHYRILEFTVKCHSQVLSSNVIYKCKIATLSTSPNQGIEP